MTTKTMLIFVGLMTIFGSSKVEADHLRNDIGIYDNILFTTHLYNASNCSNTSLYKNNTFQNVCLNETISHGYPKCCNDLLSEISLFENASFRQCIKTNLTFTNLTGLSYDCNITSSKHLGIGGLFTYIGFVTVCICVIGCIFMLWYKIGDDRQNSYERINS